MEHNLSIHTISCQGFQNKYCPHGGFSIEWDGTAGFGQLDIIFDEEGKAHLYTEYMCSQNDKLFALNAEAKRSQEDSLLHTRDLRSEILDRQIEIVKHIVAVKQAEATAAKEAAERKAQKQRIMEIIAKKEDDSLQNMPLDELKKMVAEM